MSNLTAVPRPHLPRREVESAVVRFAGDSGDGMQLTGSQFTQATALAGNDLATFPDFPAEIRAPAGTTFGVSAFQIHFGGRKIMTAGDELDALVAMNPAALKTNVDMVKAGGMVIVDTGAFGERNLKKAGYDHDPLHDGSLAKYRVIEVDMSRGTLDAVKPFGLSQKHALRCKNMWALGLVFWIYGRDRAPTVKWLQSKFASKDEVAEANIAALNAGHAFGETAEIQEEIGPYQVPRAHLAPGQYRTVTGTEATAWGLLAGAQLAGLHVTFCSYPITPASTLLHVLARLGDYGVTTFQAEDEIAAACAAIGASYAGSLGICSSSGPGIALKTEAVGLAISIELPLILVNAQRAGPSTGMPTKTEQSDLYQAVYGRNADSPAIVLAARSSTDCFDVAIEAVRLATRFMTPVYLLTDGYIANAAEPWLIPDFGSYAPFPVQFHTEPEGFQPSLRRDDGLSRIWPIPGTPGLAHRVGGLEKDHDSGHISYDPENHHRMTKMRAAKIAAAAEDIPPQAVDQGPTRGAMAIVGWGSTYGSISRAVTNLRDKNYDVAHIHLRHLWPLPRNLGELLRGYDHVLVPEMNNGQLITVLRSTYLVPAEGLNKISGQPFKIAEIESAVRARLESRDESGHAA